MATPSPKLAAYNNIIDADGHILEPPDVWEKYIDPKFRNRALRIRVGRDGREYLELDGRPSKFFNIKALTFLGGLFDRFPGVKVVLLESSAGWVGATLDRMDTTYDTALGKSMELKGRPSDYFRKHCWVSGDPDEKALALIVDYVGNDRFFWASDFPHFDHPADYMNMLGTLVAPLSETARRNLLGDSCARLYKINPKRERAH